MDRIKSGLKYVKSFTEKAIETGKAIKDVIHQTPEFDAKSVDAPEMPPWKQNRRIQGTRDAEGKRLSFTPVEPVFVEQVNPLFGVNTPFLKDRNALPLGMFRSLGIPDDLVTETDIARQDRLSQQRMPPSMRTPPVSLRAAASSSLLQDSPISGVIQPLPPSTQWLNSAAYQQPSPIQATTEAQPSPEPVEPTPQPTPAPLGMLTPSTSGGLDTDAKQLLFGSGESAFSQTPQATPPARDTVPLLGGLDKLFGSGVSAFGTPPEPEITPAKPEDVKQLAKPQSRRRNIEKEATKMIQNIDALLRQPRVTPTAGAVRGVKLQNAPILKCPHCEKVYKYKAAYDNHIAREH